MVVKCACAWWKVEAYNSGQCFGGLTFAASLTSRAEILENILVNEVMHIRVLWVRNVATLNIFLRYLSLELAFATSRSIS